MAKQAQLERWDRFNANCDVADEILVRAGILQRCSACQAAYDHFYVVHPETDLTEAYKIASAMFRDDDELVREYDRRAVLDTIKDRCHDAPCNCECPSSRWKEDD